jgi:hypothetical protein
MVGGEHHAEGRDDRVEAGIVERQRLGIGLLEADLQALGGGTLGAALEQRADVVGRRHPAATSRRGERRVAVAGGDVEDALVGAQVAGFGDDLADVTRSCR